MRIAPAFLAASLTAVSGACLGGCAAREPLIDHINVSDAKYNGDLSACREQSSGFLPFTHGSVGDCMKGKGYTVLMGTGL